MHQDRFRAHFVGKVPDENKKKSQERKDKRKRESDLHQQIDNLIIDIIKVVGKVSSR